MKKHQYRPGKSKKYNLTFKRIHMSLFSIENVLVCPIDTVKPVHNDHPWNPKKVAIVDRWSLFGGHL
jgi:hypothetical protein